MDTMTEEETVNALEVFQKVMGFTIQDMHHSDWVVSFIDYSKMEMWEAITSCKASYKGTCHGPECLHRFIKVKKEKIEMPNTATPCENREEIASKETILSLIAQTKKKIWQT